MTSPIFYQADNYYENKLFLLFLYYLKLIYLINFLYNNKNSILLILLIIN
jgi:hypothetical protein